MRVLAASMHFLGHSILPCARTPQRRPVTGIRPLACSVHLEGLTSRAHTLVGDSCGGLGWHCAFVSCRGLHYSRHRVVGSVGVGRMFRELGETQVSCIWEWEYLQDGKLVKSAGGLWQLLWSLVSFVVSLLEYPVVLVAGNQGWSHWEPDVGSSCFYSLFLEISIHLSFACLCMGWNQSRSFVGSRGHMPWKDGEAVRSALPFSMKGTTSSLGVPSGH